MTAASLVTADQAVADTRKWIEHAVIGLNLCPFAKAVHVRGQIHFATYLPADDEGLTDALLAEASRLVAFEPSERDTTLLIAPHTMADFLEFNALTARAERRLRRDGFEGVLQLASFHPFFQFAGSDAAEIANASNRSPYPTLHLLREDSVSRAVDAFPEAEAIFERNIRTLEALGTDGWARLNVGPGGAQP
ncbi:MAG: DUF1415 domain-containing protein [Gammaproteobacteria bacterium]|nr:DUF1415 domain-containing protein [Gammaproteobacteria bacterium]MBU1440601.1 DUF1415 domain-containing protein [Gammaproteobacteria bacterium]MBU2287623.1 DUF1415 domain-containing protein [Gammaproteobacteria bacterium]MBU2410627.1 DUF1415 domain-containing protein [Gammaproteobacteria bacterium]